MRMRLQLPPGNGVRSASSHRFHERVQVGVVRAKHREVIVVVRVGLPRLLQLDLDPRRSTPHPVPEAVLPPVPPQKGYRWRRIGQKGVAGDAGHAAIGAPVAEPDAAEGGPRTARAAVFARSIGHTSTLRRSSPVKGGRRAEHRSHVPARPLVASLPGPGAPRSTTGAQSLDHAAHGQRRDEGLWSGRRDSNPRPSPWQGGRDRPSGALRSCELGVCPDSCPARPPESAL